eukprot:GEMP01020024.1.p1 GENE.GEMP01020024.1~~GEMP01020024.1.p1  ORF type:complete len:655 (+),score=153.84 GEMP01020024.1:70-2034(+)
MGKLKDSTAENKKPKVDKDSGKKNLKASAVEGKEEKPKDSVAMKKAKRPQEAGGNKKDTKQKKQLRETGGKEGKENDTKQEKTPQGGGGNERDTKQKKHQEARNSEKISEQKKRPRETGGDKKDVKQKKGFMYEAKCLANKVVDTTKEIDRPAVITEIWKKIEDSEMTAFQFGVHPTGSRILQAMLKHGTVEQRRMIRLKYQEHLTELVQTKYGILLAEKIFRYSTKLTTNRQLTEAEKGEQRKIFATLVEPFLVEKTISKLFFHKLGCRFLNFVYFLELTKASTQHKLVNTIALPKKISFLVDGMVLTKPMRENVQLLNDNQKKQVAQHLGEVCDRLVDKELLQLALVQIILKCYADVERDDNLANFVQNRLPIDGVPHLLSTKAGADALIRFLGFVTAKQRKEFVRHLKGKWAECSLNNIDYLIVMRFFETIDDTVLAKNSVIKELIEELPQLMTDKIGRKVLGTILTSQDSIMRRRIISPPEQDLLQLPAPTALKNPETRRKELVTPLLDAMTPLLTTDKLLELAKDVNAKDLIVAYFDNVSEDHASRAGFAKVVAGALEKDVVLLDDGTTASLLSSLILNSASMRDELWNALQSRLAEVLPTRLNFVLVDLLKVKPEIRVELGTHIESLRKVSEFGAKLLLKELESHASN